MIIIRVAKLTDLKQIRQLELKLIDYEKPFDSRIPKNKKIKYYNLKELILSKKTKLLVVEDNNKLIACGFAEIKKEPSWLINKSVGYIGLIFVEENYRGKGISKKIISNLKKWLKQNKIKEVQIKVYSENKTALTIYRKSGFKDFMIELRSKL